MKPMILKEKTTKWLAEAGALVLQMMQHGFSGELKADDTPVTAIDHAVEQLLRERIQAAFPEHGIIGEESESYQPDAEYCWVIDPIDGTRALLAGFASFTILVALSHRGLPHFGAIYQPITKELWMGIVGEKSTLADSTISTRNCEKLSNAFFSTTSPLLFKPEQRATIEAIIQQCVAYQFGGDAYAYAKLASGRIDLIIESGLKPHDFMALAPVIQGAGGIITDWQGKALHLGSAGEICAAGDTRIHQKALAILSKL
jgi:inositol-phosphate phosphatase/L-galactose 1-phosphate phosphatase/histidinol-phosphatase